MEIKGKNIQYGHIALLFLDLLLDHIFVHVDKIITVLLQITRKIVLQVNKKDGITSSTANLVTMPR
ncbi:hypothetical protein [Gordonibacter sp. 28C]|uniref:hypothetical protein n=1 Tax=Gordonibacter sp. 28C TaxID=2078569 RepID=UPI0011C06B2E|nr:hypothetical protein [Gordonibacter sp. 28C]